MPDQKKQPKEIGRYCCTYQNKRFYGATKEEALKKREEYTQKKANGDNPCQSKNANI